MLRPLLSTFASAAFVAAISYQAATPAAAPEQREAWFVPDGATARFVDDGDCVVTCWPSIESEFDEVCEHDCEVNP